MPRTALQLITLLQAQRFGYMPNSNGLVYLNWVHDDLVARIPALSRHLQGAPTTVAFSVSDQEKPAGLILNQLEYVRWVPNTGDPVILQPTAIENLTRGIASNAYRNQPNGSPTKFAIVFGLNNTQRIILDVPVAVAGTLQIYGSTFGTTIVDATVLPEIYSDKVYYEGVSYQFKLDRLESDVAFYYNTYETEVLRLKAWIKTMAEGYQDDDTQNVRDEIEGL